MPYGSYSLAEAATSSPMLARLEGAQVRPATDWAAEAAMGVRQF